MRKMMSDEIGVATGTIEPDVKGKKKHVPRMKEAQMPKESYRQVDCADAKKEQRKV